MEIHVVTKTNNRAHATVSVEKSSYPGLPSDSVRVQPVVLSLASNNLSYARFGYNLNWYDYPFQTEKLIQPLSCISIGGMHTQFANPHQHHTTTIHNGESSRPRDMALSSNLGSHYYIPRHSSSDTSRWRLLLWTWSWQVLSWMAIGLRYRSVGG